MKVLIVTYDMIPHAFTWGGCQRMYFLTKRLKEVGIETKVIAIRSTAYNTFGKEVFSDTVFTEPKPTEKLSSSSSASTGSNIGVKTSIKKAAFALDTVLFNEIQAGNGLKAYQRFRLAKQTICDQVKEQHYDVAIVSGPPFVVFDAIPLIKRYSPETRIIMDYRDPWNFWHAGNPLTTFREKKIQKTVDAIVCTNEALCTDMSRKFGFPSSKYHVIANGYAEDMPVESTKEERQDTEGGRFNISYTGAIAFNGIVDSYRDTTKLISALRKIVDEGKRLITITFVGAADPDTEEVRQLRQEFGEAIQIVGHVPSADAKQFVADSDACLLLHTANDASGKYLVSGKLYDYIQQKKFVLSIASEQSQHATLLSKFGFGMNSENDTEKIKVMIDNAYDRWKTGQLQAVYNNVDINQFSRDAQIEKYIDLIKTM